MSHDAVPSPAADASAPAATEPVTAAGRTGLDAEPPSPVTVPGGAARATHHLTHDPGATLR